MPPPAPQKYLPPFFQLTGPPPAIPLLTTQIELAPRPSVFPLLAELDLSPSKPPASTEPNARAATLLVVRSPHLGPHRTAPYKKRSVRIRSPSPDNSPSSAAADFGSSFEESEDELEDEPEDQSDDESNGDDDESNDQILEMDDGTFPKPPGEVGRPGRGGYNLKKSLKWSDKEFKRFRDIVHREAKKHLDMKICYSQQSQTALRAVREIVTAEVPKLGMYTGVWPLSDALKMRLKYTAAKASAKGEGEGKGKDRGDSKGKGSGRGDSKGKGSGRGLRKNSKA